MRRQERRLTSAWFVVLLVVILAVALAQAAAPDETLLDRLHRFEGRIEIATVVARSALLSPTVQDIDVAAAQVAMLLDGADGILAIADALLAEIATLEVESTTRLELRAALETAIEFLQDARSDIELLQNNAEDPRQLMRRVYGALIAAIGLEDSSFTLPALRHIFAALPDAEILVVPGDSVQAAIDRVLPGGIVRLARGVHTVRDTLSVTKDLSLLGPVESEGTATIAFPVGMQYKSLLDIDTWQEKHDAIQVVIQDLTFAGSTDGVTIRGSGDQRNEILFRQVVIRDCLRTGLSIAGSDVRIENCRFEGNDDFGLQAILGAVVEAYDSAFDSNGSRENLELEYRVLAGVYAIDNAALTLDGCTISANTAPAVFAEDSARLTLRDCHVIDNERDGIVLWDETELILRDCHVLRNGGFGIRFHHPDCSEDPLTFISHFFNGSVLGSGNLIPAGGTPDANQKGDICPTGYEFLLDG